MTDRKDLEGKLASASPWVRAEFAFLVDVGAGLGCDAQVESGPGLAFRLRRQTIFRAHPKARHIALGLPDRMREEVHELTGALRRQRLAAWFNYSPDSCDRDTVELLISVSVDPGDGHVAKPSRQGAAPTTAFRNDEADLGLVLNVLHAFRRHEETTGMPSPVKPLRGTIFFQWEGPRLPAGGKYSPLIPHSPAARARRAEGTASGLVYEHVAPISAVVRQLLTDLPPDIHGLRRALDASAERVIITREEDALLTAAGFRNSAPDPTDPWSRYGAIGLQKHDFVPAR
ncbi:MAG TPA: hypothetical protein VFH54_17640 [Mycobacteriales bacterium]|nr:hypothetical protein [Mycobacteriales bacterium]